MTPRGTFWVAAAAVLSLVSPGAFGAWQGTGNRNASLASARLSYALSGSEVTGGGTGYSWSVVLSLAGSATNHFTISNTGSVTETIRATVSATGLNLGGVTVYGCANAFTGANCTGRVTLGSANGTFALATNLAAGSSYNIAVQATGVLGLALTVTIPANSFTITPRTGINRTSG